MIENNSDDHDNHEQQVLNITPEQMNKSERDGNNERNINRICHSNSNITYHRIYHFMVFYLN